MVKMIKKELNSFRGRFILFLIGLSAVASIGWVQLEPSIILKESTKMTTREILLEIRDMAFGNNNPTISIRPGETVRFIIYNLDPGMKHNFAIVGTDISTRLLNYGEQVSVLFSPPAEGEWIYQCNPHAAMMNGRLQVSKQIASL